MKPHLKSVSGRYKQGDFKINPISLIDSEIITELIEIFRKLDKKELKETVENWKYLSDEEIRDILIQWNIDNPDKATEEETEQGEKKEKEIKKVFINLGKYVIPDWAFTGIKYDNIGLRAIINPFNSDSAKNPYNNLVIRFNTEFEMDTFKQNIKEKIKSEIIEL